MTYAVRIAKYQTHLLNRENAFLKINSMKPYEGGDNEGPSEICHSHLDGGLLLIVRPAKVIVNNEA